MMINDKKKLQRLKVALKEIPSLDVFESFSDRRKFSRDFFDYSPVLKEQLNSCLAEIVVRPKSIQAVVEVSLKCKKYRVPLTVRGSGTGNYGQCVPLHGGVVILMSSIRNIRKIDQASGHVTVETGCLMRDLEGELREQGRQLRLTPSTWRSATIGGFVAGGSGGIGSVRWGFLRDPGNLLGLEVVTVEDKPKIIQLDANSAEALNHAYGTNGIITSLTLATTHSVEWQEVAIDCTEWSDAVSLLKNCAMAAVDIFLCSLLEKEIVKNMPQWSGPPSGKHRLLMLVAPDAIDTIKRLASSAGAQFNHIGPENINSGNGLRELSWNHTTFHMRLSDPSWTYLQMLLPLSDLSTMDKLKEEFAGNLLWHLEVVRQFGSQRLAALPLVRWENEKALNVLIKRCKELGALIFNPHVITVEDGGLGVIDSDQVEAKRRYDPEGLLNPGKLKGWL